MYKENGIRMDIPRSDPREREMKRIEVCRKILPYKSQLYNKSKMINTRKIGRRERAQKPKVWTGGRSALMTVPAWSGGWG